MSLIEIILDNSQKIKNLEYEDQEILLIDFREKNYIPFDNYFFGVKNKNSSNLFFLRKKYENKIKIKAIIYEDKLYIFTEKYIDDNQSKIIPNFSLNSYNHSTLNQNNFFYLEGIKILYCNNNIEYENYFQIFNNMTFKMLREEINQTNLIENKNYVFMQNENEIIKINLENQILIKNVLKEKDFINIEKFEKEIIAKIENQNEYKINYFLDIKLSDLKLKLKEENIEYLKNNEFLFENSEKIIRIEQEENFILDDILENYQFNIILIKNIPIYSNEKEINNLNKLNVSINDNISYLRKKLNLTKDSNFKDKNNNIFPILNENQEKILNIINDSKIYINEEISEITVAFNNYESMNKAFQNYKNIIFENEKKKILKKSINQKIINFKLYQYQSKPFTKFENENCLNIIFLGETGTGKTSLINSLINYICQVDNNDNYRFYLANEKININQSYSQTRDVNIYNINSHFNNPALKIIDTPGLNDTGGKKYDLQTIEKIKYTIFNKLPYINAICFFIKSSEVKLKKEHDEIFNKLIKIFDKKMENNVLFIITFGEDENSEALKLICSDVFPLKSVVSKIKQKNFWNFHFNKSIIFPDSNNLIENIKYNKQMENFKNFIEKVKSLPRVTISNEFIYSYYENLLKNIIKQFEENIKKILNCKKNIESTEELIKVLISSCEIVEKINLSNIEYSLVCPICQTNCQLNYEIGKEFSCFNNKEKCKNCKNNCNFDSHKIVNFKYKKHKIKLIEKDNDLKKTYIIQTKELNKQNEMLKEYTKEYIKIKIEWFDIYDKLKETEKKIQIIQNEEVNNNENEQYNNILNNLKDEYYNLKTNFQTQMNIKFKEFLLKNQNLIEINYYSNDNFCILF